jgi:hypothetical protein
MNPADSFAFARTSSWTFAVANHVVEIWIRRPAAAPRDVVDHADLIMFKADGLSVGVRAVSKLEGD